MNERIKQIIPAVGWVAIYEGPDGKYTRAVVCFALVEHKEIDYVTPMVMNDENEPIWPETIDGFQRLDHPDNYRR